jgi:hypothetical protein
MFRGQDNNCCFAIIPDGEQSPAAVFEHLEDAMDWGVRKYGGGRFAIRHVSMTESAAMPNASKTSAN